MSDKPKFELRHSGDMTLRKNADGSVTASGSKPAALHIDKIRSVGVENLVHVETHTINRVFNSVSHYIKFFGGGEVRFSYNLKGELLEFTATGADAEVLNGDRILLKRRETGDGA